MSYVSRCCLLLACSWLGFLGASANAEPAKVRLLKIQGIYQDHPDDLSPMSLFFGSLERAKSFPDLCRQIESWTRDPEVHHVVLDLTTGDAQLNLAQALELNRHLHNLRHANKRTFAWLGNASSIAYLLASSCDQILMSELCALDFASLSLTALHFHDLLELIGAEASVVRVGNFKGAVEPFTLSEMSPELRAHYQDMLTSMNEALVSQIAPARKVDPKQVRAAQEQRLFTASQAKAAGWVDEVVPPGQQRATVSQLLETDVEWLEPARPKAAKPLSFFDLMGKLLAPSTRPAARKPSLAVLHLDGQIIDGPASFPGVLSPGTIAEAVDEIIADDAVRGVVVRVNSPGGSASASEAIRRSLERLAKAKPVNFSFGSVAASGGYWISCIGRPIYAEPTTLTGSIGVFAIKLSAGKLLDRVGLKLDTVSLDSSATAFSLTRGWSTQEQARIQMLVDEVYDRFLSLVSASRPLAPAQLEDLAGGRVWSGTQAVERKLADHLGGLNEALNALAHQAGLEPNFPLIHWPQKKSFLESLELFGVAAKEPPWAQSLPLTLRKQLPWPLLHDALQQAPVRAWLLHPDAIQVR